MKMNDSSVGAKQKTPAPINLLTVRSMLVLRGDSLNAWAIRNKWSGKYAHLAVRGLRKGPKALLIVETLKAELGV